MSQKTTRENLVFNCDFVSCRMPSLVSDHIDGNTDGIVASTFHVHQLEEHNSEKWKHLSLAAFAEFDVDRDVYITPEELRVHTGLKGSIDPLLEEADIDKDGKISLSDAKTRKSYYGSKDPGYVKTNKHDSQNMKDAEPLLKIEISDLALQGGNRS
ncbi:hypothetical protein L2E82_44006 [Cichorium intybus]|uniref:Uncharacterized protein n=1 Tax=Cichorium intybus TaxID=13427 RepID=A0ACB8ZP48_CICIN|nr:hypothetical protein L2E82_44006 [Cichorium intybus]